MLREKYASDIDASQSLSPAAQAIGALLFRPEIRLHTRNSVMTALPFSGHSPTCRILIAIIGPCAYVYKWTNMCSPWRVLAGPFWTV